MNNSHYQVMELIGSSEEGIEQAINNAIAEAGTLHGKLDWYEVIETRGHTENGKNKHYQAHLKIGCNTH